MDKSEALDWLLSKLSAAKKAPKNAISTPKAPEVPKIKPRADLAETKQTEVELWKKWKESKEDPKHLDPLLKSFNGLLQSRVNVWKRAEVPTSFVEFKHKQKFVEALRTWKPEKGPLGSWVYQKVQNAGRDVKKYQNIVRVPENISEHIGSFNAVKSALREKLGHEPDSQTIHDHILKTDHPTLGKLSLKTIIRLEKEQRKGLIEGFESEVTGPSPILSSRAEEVSYLIIPQLSPDERAVHEFSLGLNGKPKLKPGQIAKKLNMDGPQVSKLRRSVFEKMQPYLRGQQ